MLLDRSLRLALRNYSTLFLLALVVTAPVAAVYTVVGGSDLATGDVPGSLWVAVAVAAFALPLLRRPARRILARDLAGDVPTVADALRYSRTQSQPEPLPGSPLWAITVSAAMGVLVGGLGLAVGLAAGGVMPERVRFGWIAGSLAVSVASGAPFPLSVLALCAARAKGGPRNSRRQQ